MHAFHDSSDFAFFRGLEVEQVCLGQYQTQIHLSNASLLSIHPGSPRVSSSLTLAIQTEFGQAKQPDLQSGVK